MLMVTTYVVGGLRAHLMSVEGFVGTFQQISTEEKYAYCNIIIVCK